VAAGVPACRAERTCKKIPQANRAATAWSRIAIMNRLERIRAIAATEITEEERRAADRVLRANRVAIFVVAYNAETHLEKLMDRFPPDIMPLLAEIFVIDDSSTDATFATANRIRSRYSNFNIQVYKTPFNRGYGGNQKLGYLYCSEQKHDIAVLLHGDGQYAPEFIPRILAPFDAVDVDAIFASRMLNRKRALEGGMPLYKWLGNQVLTFFENRMLKSDLSEFHTGFRAYRISSLAGLPFVLNSDDFHFDTEIIIQAIANRWQIREVSIPAYYGDEQCRVNGMKYAYNCAKAVLKYNLVQLGLYYQRNYDFGLFETESVEFKKSRNSLHQYLLKVARLNPEMVTLELGANRGYLSSHIAKKVKDHIAVNHALPDSAGESRVMQMDLDRPIARQLAPRQFDACFTLDVIEHLNEPERFLSEVFQLLKTHGMLYISTANVCYFPVRLSLLLGQFNYGKKGILDRTHKRLFSVSSFRRLIRQYGFQIEFIRGFPPPLTDLISSGKFMKILEKIHAWLSLLLPNLFAYNFLVVAVRMDDINDIFDQTVHSNKSHSR